MPVAVRKLHSDKMRNARSDDTVVLRPQVLGEISLDRSDVDGMVSRVAGKIGLILCRGPGGSGADKQNRDQGSGDNSMQVHDILLQVE